MIETIIVAIQANIKIGHVYCMPELSAGNDLTKITQIEVNVN